MDRQPLESETSNHSAFIIKIVILIVVIIGHFSFFHSSFLWALRNYEYSNKMQWVEENNKYYPTLRVFTQLNPNSTHPNKLRIKELIVVNPETNEILVQDQYDKKASFSNAKFSQNADQFDYRLEYPTFYYSQDYSVLQKRSDMRWLIKGTLHHAENETRVYFKIKHPNDPLTKKLASNKKNMFVFIAIGFFIGGLVLSLMYLKASIEQLKHDKQYSDIIVAVLGVIAVIYFIFYKMIWLWLQIEF